MNSKNWQKRWNSWIIPTELPGIYQRKEGGYLVRVKAVDPVTAKKVESRATLPEATKAEALAWQEQERARIRAGSPQAKAQQTRFAEFAASLFERKVQQRDIKSAAGRQKWQHTLTHLIAGTEGESGHRASGFGEMFVDKIKRSHVMQWKSEVSQLIAAGDYAPTTANGWLSILRVVMKAAKYDFELNSLATEDIPDFDESEHATYTEEDPNTIRPEVVPEFLTMMSARHPQHYAMVLLAIVTGLRPSSLRPLRRSGPQADLKWESGRLLVRRSQTRGHEVMNTTKQRQRYPIQLPKDVLKILEWHVETQLTSPEMRDSELLFPSITGGFRSPNVLNKPLADVSEVIGLGYTVTQKGLRRAFNDLARAAGVDALVKKSISGHQTDDMVELYSSVAPEEQLSGVARVYELAKYRRVG